MPFAAVETLSYPRPGPERRLTEPVVVTVVPEVDPPEEPPEEVPILEYLEEIQAVPPL